MVTEVEQPAQQSQIVPSVHQQMEPARQEGPQVDETQQDGEEAAQGPVTAAQQGVQRLSTIVSAVLRMVRYIVQTAVSLLRAALLALQEALTAALRLVTRALVPVVQELGEILRQVMRALASVVQFLVKLLWRVLASVLQLLWELLRPLLLEALHELVQPLLQRAAERSVAAVVKTLEATAQERQPAQPAPAGAPEAAAR
jgi:energy-coupling factor transporter transmembrane protein EcfT